LIGSLPIVGNKDISATINKCNEAAQLLKQFNRSESTKDSCTENNAFASNINVDIVVNVQDGTKAGGRQ
jgi:hypothetical protein